MRLWMVYIVATIAWNQDIRNFTFLIICKKRLLLISKVFLSTSEC
jgi:hypothetical protein